MLTAVVSAQRFVTEFLADMNVHLFGLESLAGNFEWFDILHEYDVLTDPEHFYPYQITVRMISTGKYRRMNAFADRRKGMAEAKDCARYGYLNDWDRVIIHDAKTGSLIKVHRAAVDEADGDARFAPRKRKPRRKAAPISIMHALLGA